MAPGICTALNEEFSFFHNLLLGILVRRRVFEKFDNKLTETELRTDNDVILLIQYGYIISQLSDCRKFFARNGDAHSFKFVVRHIKNKKLNNGHAELFKIWKKKKLEIVLNKYLLHADRRFADITTEISVQALNELVDGLEGYVKQIFYYLNKNYSDIDFSIYDTYLLDREVEVEEFFEEAGKVS